MDADEFKLKWGFTQEEIGVLMATTRNTVSHWYGKGKTDQGRSASPSAQRSLELWDSILTHWQDCDRRYAQEYQIFLAAKKRGKGTAFKDGDDGARADWSGREK